MAAKIDRRTAARFRAHALYVGLGYTTTLLGCSTLLGCASSASQPSAADAAIAADGSVDAGSVATKAIEVRFAAKVGADAFSCSKTYAVGSAATTVEPLDFRMYVHAIKVGNAAGRIVDLGLEQDGKWQTADTALIDFEDKTGSCQNGTAETNTSVRGVIPADFGPVTKVAFNVGVPVELNHTDVTLAPSPLNLSSLSWDWTTGHKFFRTDFRVKSAAAATTVVFHLGATGCSPNFPDKCKNGNRPTIELANFNSETNTIALDYGKLMSGVDFTSDKGGTPGCLSAVSDPECKTVFPLFGLDIATGASSGSQQVFSVQ